MPGSSRRPAPFARNKSHPRPVRHGTLLGALLLGAVPQALSAAAAPPAYDLIIANGLIYDGSGGRPFRGDVAIVGDRIVHVGAKPKGRAKRIVDANGLAIAPGFINSMSWATFDLIANPDAESDLRQGITLEVLNEGVSPGPRHAGTDRELAEEEINIPADFTWQSFGDYMSALEKRGISVNIAGWVGATTIRSAVLGDSSAAPGPEQLARMRAMVEQAMKEGALGVSSALIYSPGFYAGTDELASLAEVAGRCGGMYISHMRSEGNQFLEALDELITIAKKSGAPAEVTHIKVGGPTNWHKMAVALDRMEAARASGARITANVYPYTASGTGLTASMPPWLQVGGISALKQRLQDSELRARAIAEMQDPDQPWENVMRGAGGADGVLIAALANPDLAPMSGKTLAEIAGQWGVVPEEAALRLVEQDNSRVGAIYSTMREEDLIMAMRHPYVSVGSDAGVLSSGNMATESSSHPRGFGTFARIFARYVREKHIWTVEEAVRRLTSLPAGKYGIADRGTIKPGYFADIVLFDPARMQDRATYLKPREGATGVRDVFVNGVQIFENGHPTAARAGRYIKGRAANEGGCRATARDWPRPG